MYVLYTWGRERECACGVRACVRACVRTLIRAFVRLFVVSFIYSFPGLVLFAKYLDGQRSNYFSSLVNALGYNLIKLIADGYRKRFYFLFCSIIFVINSFFPPHCTFRSIKFFVNYRDRCLSSKTNSFNILSWDANLSLSRFLLIFQFLKWFHY